VEVWSRRALETWRYGGCGGMEREVWRSGGRVGRKFGGRTGVQAGRSAQGMCTAILYGVAVAK